MCRTGTPAQVTNTPTLQRNQQNADHLQERDEISVFINLITRLHLENVQVTQLVGLAAVLPTLLIWFYPPDFSFIFGSFYCLLIFSWKSNRFVNKVKTYVFFVQIAWHPCVTRLVWSDLRRPGTGPVLWLQRREERLPTNFYLLQMIRGHRHKYYKILSRYWPWSQS